MQQSVLTLGERIVLAARLAAIEHVRREMEAAEPTTLSLDSRLMDDSSEVHHALSIVFQRALSGGLEAA